MIGLPSQKVIVSLDPESKKLFNKLIDAVEQFNANHAAKAAEDVPVKKEPDVPTAHRGSPYRQ